MVDAPKVVIASGHVANYLANQTSVTTQGFYKSNNSTRVWKYFGDSDSGGGYYLNPASTAAESLYSSYPTAEGWNDSTSSNDASSCHLQFTNLANFVQRGYVTKSASVAYSIDASSIFQDGMGEIGFVILKSMNATGDWYVWHRSFAAGANARLGTTALPTTTSPGISVDQAAKTVTIISSLAAGAYRYLVLAHHFDGPNAVIECGSYTGTGNSTGFQRNLTWGQNVTGDLEKQPQFFLTKSISGGTGNWALWTKGMTDGQYLFLNSNAGLATSTTSFNPKGFNEILMSGSDQQWGLGGTLADANTSARNYAFVLIRRGPVP
jgi:hypothetical protein